MCECPLPQQGGGLRLFAGSMLAALEAQLRIEFNIPGRPAQATRQRALDLVTSYRFS